MIIYSLQYFKFPAIQSVHYPYIVLTHLATRNYTLPFVLFSKPKCERSLRSILFEIKVYLCFSFTLIYKLRAIMMCANSFLFYFSFS